MDAAQCLIGELHALKDDAPVMDARAERAAQGVRLLHDLLEHKVRIAALFRCGDLPVDVMVLLDDDLLHRVAHGDAVRRQNGDLAVLHIRHIARVFDKRGHVGGDEAASVAVADQKRRVLARGVDAVRLVGAENAERIRALDAVQHHVQRIQNGAGLLIEMVEKLRDDLTVGLGGEMHALFLQILAQLHVVFDDAVVDERDLAVLADMRVRVGVIRLAVGRPAGMADAGHPMQRRAVIGHLDQILETALGLGELKPAFTCDADAGGVVAPVFQT